MTDTTGQFRSLQLALKCSEKEKKKQKHNQYPTQIVQNPIEHHENHLLPTALQLYFPITFTFVSFLLLSLSHIKKTKVLHCIFLPSLVCSGFGASASSVEVEYVNCLMKQVPLLLKKGFLLHIFLRFCLGFFRSDIQQKKSRKERSEKHVIVIVPHYLFHGQ